MVPEQRKALHREYQEVGNNLRHYGNLRIGRLAMLFTLNAALLAAKSDIFDSRIRSVVGLLVVTLFWLADVHIRRC